jgi:hypothetical protein
MLDDLHPPDLGDGNARAASMDEPHQRYAAAPFAKLLPVPLASSTDPIVAIGHDDETVVALAMRAWAFQLLSNLAVVAEYLGMRVVYILDGGQACPEVDRYNPTRATFSQSIGQSIGV